MTEPVLVTGATGTVGRVVVRALLDDGMRVRAAAGHPDRVADLFGDEVEAVGLDFTDPATWSAFTGVERMFLLRPPQLGRPKTQMLPALEYARTVGVRQVVFLSLQGADHITVVPHAVIEAWLRASGLDWTFVRASFFMQNMTTTHLADIRDRDEIVVPAGRGSTAFVDAVDVGQVAAAALVDPQRHRNRAWTPTGPSALTYTEVARILTRVLGRTIRYPRPGVIRYAVHAHRALGMPWGKIVVTTAIYTLARFGRAADLTTDVQAVLGRPPTGFGDFAGREHAAFTPDPTSPAAATPTRTAVDRRWASVGAVRDLLGQALLIPRVAWLARRSPRDPDRGWNRYWGQVRGTGVGGDVLWDTGDLDEALSYLDLMRAHLDMGLPMVDIGCGNGRFTRRLAAHVPKVLGVDLAANAIARAVSESAGLPNVTFRVLDAAAPGATTPIATEMAPANVFVRGVFHVLTPAEQAVVARNLLPLVGTTGRVFLTETNYRGSPLGYLRHLGATPGRIPAPLERAIQTIPQPGHFGPQERHQAFPDADWTVLSDGATDVQTIPLNGSTEPEHIPGYYAIITATTAASSAAVVVPPRRNPPQQ